MTTKEILPQIAPTSSSQPDKYSLNLWRWVRKFSRNHPRMGLCLAFTTEGKKEYDPAKTQAGSLYIGYGSGKEIVEDGWLHGARLSEVLCNGVKAASFAHPPKMKFEIIPDWWERYIAGGKCFIDPQHTLYYDQERWQESADGKERTCLWCGKHKQYWHIEKIERGDWIDRAPEEQGNV